MQKLLKRCQAVYLKYTTVSKKIAPCPRLYYTVFQISYSLKIKMIRCQLASLSEKLLWSFLACCLEIRKQQSSIIGFVS